EERFRTLAESIEDVFYMTNLEQSALEYLSPAYERIWGRPAAELLGNLSIFPDTLHPDDLSIFEAGKAAQVLGEPVTVEYRIVRPDGEVRWIYDRSFPVGDGVGRRSAGIASDVTARRQADAAARETEERLRQFGETSHDILWIRDAETLQWTYLTPAFETIYGLSREEALSGDNYRGWQELIVPEDHAYAVASIGRVRAGEHVTFEYRIRRPIDGRVRWLRNTDFPMRDTNGCVARIGGVGQDVTELKAIEAAVAESEQRLRTLVDGVPQLVWRAIDGGDWTWASPQWAAYTGQSEPDSHHQGWLEPLHPDDRDRAMTAWDHALEADGFEVEYRIRRAADGAYRWFQTRATPLRDGAGNIKEWLGTSTDIDDLRRLQDSQAVMVTELQHRTRNLIAVVRSIAEDTMEHTGPTEAFRGAFSDRLSALSRVQGLLSRSEAEPITIDALVRLELDALGASTLNGRVTASGPEVRLRPSSVQILALALHELATNARKHGALSHDVGRLTIIWRELIEDGRPRLVLDWNEIGLDRAPERPASTVLNGGYGRELIEQALPHALGARTTYALTEAGVRCTIDIPVRPRALDGGQL
ncbi:MAG: PAS domain-containing protein, partial [Janthinobacterium lividum]